MMFRLPRNTSFGAALALLGLLVLAPAVAADAASVAQSCDLLLGEKSARIEVGVSGEWSHRSFQMRNPDRFVVDLMGVTNSIETSSLDGDGDFVRQIRLSQFAVDPTPITRFVFDLSGKMDARVERYGGGVAVIVGEPGAPAAVTSDFTHGELALPPRQVDDPGLARDLGAETPDRWQDGGGVARIAEPQRREEDGSYARTMNINMQNADIRTVLRAIADFSGRNIISSPEVEGTVTVALAEVPWREALTVILRAHGFGFVEEDGILRVDTAANLREEELAEKAAAQQSDQLEALITKIVPIDYANAEEVMESVEVMITDRGSVEVDRRTNSLIVKDIPASVEEVSRLALELDTKTPQVHIDALMVDIDARHSQELGIKWGILDAAPSDVNVAGDLTIDNQITESAGTLRAGTVQNWAELQVQLQSLARDNVANIISNPRITTTDNREATILVGQKIPLITQDVAGNSVTRLETIGIRLVVTPHINSDRRITLDVHPEVSDLSNQATVQGGVIINTSEADTRVLVDNKETAVIGGLIRNVTTRFTAGVPVLKDLPLLGALFRTESKSDDQRELVVFLTPTVVAGEDADVGTPRQWDLKESVDELLERNAARHLD